ncbi:MAG: hypothetical protein P4L84_04520 [Isosphaeraceae bacterium]|nr:hypothetical protein [Isosphaeraceae bacterium]
MPQFDAVTSTYLKSTREIVAAARQLRGSLGAGDAVIEAAVQSLEEAAGRQETGRAAFRAYLSEPSEAVKAVQVSRNALAVALAELQSGNVLIAAGQAAAEVPLAYRPKGSLKPPPMPSPTETAGGTPEPAVPLPPGETKEESLDATIDQLEDTSQGLEPGAIQTAFAFTAPSATAPGTPVDAGTFGTDAKSALSTIVSEAAKTVGCVLTEAGKIGVDKLTAALGKLAEGLPSLGQIGRLIRLGIDKIKEAFHWLVDLVGENLLGRAKEELRKFWEKLQSGEAANGLLEVGYGIPAAKVEIERTLARSDLLTAQIGPADEELRTLLSGFHGNMELARKFASGVTIAGGLLGLIPAVGTNAVLVAATLDATILGVVFVLGRGSAGTGVPLAQTRGVLQITRGLVPGGAA